MYLFVFSSFQIRVHMNILCSYHCKIRFLKQCSFCCTILFCILLTKKHFFGLLGFLGFLLFLFIFHMKNDWVSLGVCLYHNVGSHPEKVHTYLKGVGVPLVSLLSDAHHAHRTLNQWSRGSRQGISCEFRYDIVYA